MARWSLAGPRAAETHSCTSPPRRRPQGCCPSRASRSARCAGTVTAWPTSADRPTGPTTCGCCRRRATRRVHSDPVGPSRCHPPTWRWGSRSTWSGAPAVRFMAWCTHPHWGRPRGRAAPSPPWSSPVTGGRRRQPGPASTSPCSTSPVGALPWLGWTTPVVPATGGPIVARSGDSGGWPMPRTALTRPAIWPPRAASTAAAWVFGAGVPGA